MSYGTVRTAFDARNIVGESIIWSPQEQQLYWVDIVGSAIHRLDPATGQHAAWPTPELPTSIGLCRNGGFIVGLRHRVCMWTPGGTFNTLAIPEPDRPENRLNEGVVAPDGSFWVGTMQDNIATDGSPMDAPDRTGRLYRITSDGTVHVLTDHVFGITNTMVWTDADAFITADTARNELYKFSYDPKQQRLTDIETLPLSIHNGLPDGSTQDAEGNIYNCRVAGGRQIAILSADMQWVDSIPLPCQSPTSCTFGGPDLSTLYITSARFGMSEAALAASPIEGSVLAVKLKAKGRASHVFG
jgi:sugar lactone lactonase YvrE